jgi:hypothetical protein
MLFFLIRSLKSGHPWSLVVAGPCLRHSNEERKERRRERREERKNRKREEKERIE